MKYDEFKQSLLNEVIKTKPKQFRLGQAVFNYVDDKYGIARDVQFEDHIDCFYIDDNIEPFLKSVFNRLYKDININNKAI